MKNSGILGKKVWFFQLVPWGFGRWKGEIYDEYVGKHSKGNWWCKKGVWKSQADKWRIMESCDGTSNSSEQDLEVKKHGMLCFL